MSARGLDVSECFDGFAAAREGAPFVAFDCDEFGQTSITPKNSLKPLLLDMSLFTLLSRLQTPIS